MARLRGVFRINPSSLKMAVRANHARATAIRTRSSIRRTSASPFSMGLPMEMLPRPPTTISGERSMDSRMMCRASSLFRKLVKRMVISRTAPRLSPAVVWATMKPPPSARRSTSAMRGMGPAKNSADRLAILTLG
ncbi:MAG: hypothetical protein HYV46_18490 [candidate division NC10 bacterium]|nr:hypothetical protein [candidate division NC10 bacterium]